MMTDELYDYIRNNTKPCPFCGNTDIQSNTNGGCSRLRITCSCGAYLHVSSLDYADEKNVKALVKIWNTRKRPRK